MNRMHNVKGARNIDIVVINWNSGYKTLNAIKPYMGYCSEIISCNVIVVDNASLDDSVKILKDQVNSLIENTSNLGFAKACNQAIKGSVADYILLLNPDTYSEPKVLETLVLILEHNSSIAIAGPQQRDNDNKILYSCGRFPTFTTSLFELTGLSKLFPGIFIPVPIMTDWDHSYDKMVDHVIGSYMLIKKQVVDEIGFMDESYFLYLEDMDFSKRIKDAGYLIHFTVKESIIHEGGGSGDNIQAKRLYYFLMSRKVYWKKYFGKIQEIILISVMIAIEPFLRIIDLSIKSKKFIVRPVLRAYYNFIKNSF